MTPTEKDLERAEKIISAAYFFTDKHLQLQRLSWEIEQALAESRLEGIKMGLERAAKEAEDIDKGLVFIADSAGIRSAVRDKIVLGIRKIKPDKV